MSLDLNSFDLLGISNDSQLVPSGLLTPNKPSLDLLSLSNEEIDVYYQSLSDTKERALAAIAELTAIVSTCDSALAKREVTKLAANNEEMLVNFCCVSNVTPSLFTRMSSVFTTAALAITSFFSLIRRHVGFMQAEISGLIVACSDSSNKMAPLPVITPPSAIGDIYAMFEEEDKQLKEALERKQRLALERKQRLIMNSAFHQNADVISTLFNLDDAEEDACRINFTPYCDDAEVDSREELYSLHSYMRPAAENADAEELRWSSSLTETKDYTLPSVPVLQQQKHMYSSVHVMPLIPELDEVDETVDTESLGTPRGFRCESVNELVLEEVNPNNNQLTATKFSNEGRVNTKPTFLSQAMNLFQSTFPFKWSVSK